MKENINLVTQRKVNKRTFRRLFLVSFTVFLGVFLFAFGMLLYIMNLQSNLPPLETRAKQLKDSIEALSDKKEKVLIVKERLSSVEKIISQRKTVDTKVTEILKNFPDNISINTLGATDEKVSFRLVSQSLFDLDDLVNSKIPAFSKTSKIDVKRVDFTGFTVNKSGGYTISLDFHFNKSLQRK